MKKFIITLVCLIFLPITGYSAGVVDEMGGKSTTPSNAIPNRPMREDANLKAIQAAFDSSDPRDNIKRYPYDAKITYKIRLREFMGSTIVLPQSEKIIGYSLFDKHNFTFVPLSSKSPTLTNVFDVYAKYHGADTNLTVHGESGNIYSFYLRVDSVQSKFMPSLITYIDDPATTKALKAAALAAKKAKEAQAKIDAEKEKKAEKLDYLDEIPSKVNSSKLNFAYKMKGGNKDLAPLRVYDDGFFTFFQFGEGDLHGIQKLPTIYRVVDGYDTPVNTRIQGGAIIAEAINNKWTLRSGSAHLCIWKKDND